MQEPWCFTVDEIAALTPWQIEHLYYRPAKEAERRRAAVNEDDELSSLDPFVDNMRLDDFVDLMLSHFPPADHPESTREKWTKDFRAMEDDRIQREGK